MSLTEEQTKTARRYAATLREMQTFATSITTSPAASPYEKEMGRTLMHHAYKAETEASLLGGES